MEHLLLSKSSPQREKGEGGGGDAGKVKSLELRKNLYIKGGGVGGKGSKPRGNECLTSPCRESVKVGRNQGP